jgi:hypothetical protein
VYRQVSVLLTFSNHAWDAEFGTVSHMDERVEHTHKAADQRHWLDRCITPFYEVVRLREDVLVQSGTNAVFVDRLREECYICSIIPDKKLSGSPDWMVRHGYSLIITKTFDEVLFRDHIGRLNRWKLVGTVLLVEMFDQSTTRTRGVECQRTMGDMTSSTLN